MTDTGLRSELFISSTERSDGAVYTCRADNEFGRDERTSKLLVVGESRPNILIYAESRTGGIKRLHATAILAATETQQ